MIIILTYAVFCWHNIGVTLPCPLCFVDQALDSNLPHPDFEHDGAKAVQRL
jgi:hypothetical protein